MSRTSTAEVKRPTWDEYFLDIMNAVAKRSTCDRGRLGCVIVRDNHILATGYAGAPTGITDCDQAGHELHEVINTDGSRSQHCIRTAHAEQNAIVHAARYGAQLVGGTLYIKMTPCYACAKMIINAGIVRVVAASDYHAASRTKQIFLEAGIELEIINDHVQAYDHQKGRVDP